jgi:CheY-like chemotaxis protein
MSSPSLPTILIADDDADDRFMLHRALEKAAVKNPIASFSDGEDLLQYLLQSECGGFSASHPWLIFLDLNMPRMTGFDVLAALARLGLGPRLRTVIVSGSAREEDVERACELGAADYLVKYPTPEVLADVIAQSSTQAAGCDSPERVDPSNAHADSRRSA